MPRPVSYLRAADAGSEGLDAFGEKHVPASLSEPLFGQVQSAASMGFDGCHEIHKSHSSIDEFESFWPRAPE